MKAAKSIYNLVTSLSRTGGTPQFIGMSASLSQVSFDNCVSTIQTASGIGNIRLIHYTRADAKMYTRPRELVNVLSNQERVCVSVQNGDISDNPYSTENINLTNLFYEKMMFKLIEDGRIPGSFFHDSELEAIQTMKNFMAYLTKKDAESLWRKTKNDYERDLVTTTDSRERYHRIIKETISQLASGFINSEPIQMSRKYFDELLLLYQRSERVTLENIVYSIDLYAFLYEYKNYHERLAIFQLDVHPIYNFGNTDKLVNPLELKIGGEPTDFAKILEAENLNMDERTGLIETLSSGLKYGIGLITSSIPLAFQMQISKLLMKMKSQNENFGIKFVICDYSLSMGVDYPLSASVIIKSQRKAMKKGEEKQKAGRAGRNNEKGEYLPSTVYYVNVENFVELADDNEILSFDMQDMKDSYYGISNIEDTIRTMMTIYGNGTNFNMETFESRYFTDSIFPEINEFENKILKYKYIKHCLRELYEVTKVLLPPLSVSILQIYSGVQRHIYDYMIS